MKVKELQKKRERKTDSLSLFLPKIYRLPIMLNRVDIYALVLYETWPGVKKHTHRHTARGLRSTNPPAAGLTQQSLIALCAAKRSFHSSLILLQPWAGVTLPACRFCYLSCGCSPEESACLQIGLSTCMRSQWKSPYGYRLQPIMRSWWCHHSWDSTRKAFWRENCCASYCYFFNILQIFFIHCHANSAGL